MLVLLLVDPADMDEHVLVNGETLLIVVKYLFQAMLFLSVQHQPLS